MCGQPLDRALHSLRPEPTLQILDKTVHGAMETRPPSIHTDRFEPQRDIGSCLRLRISEIRHAVLETRNIQNAYIRWRDLFMSGARFLFPDVV